MTIKEYQTQFLAYWNAAYNSKDLTVQVSKEFVEFSKNNMDTILKTRTCYDITTPMNYEGLGRTLLEWAGLVGVFKYFKMPQELYRPSNCLVSIFVDGTFTLSRTSIYPTRTYIYGSTVPVLRKDDVFGQIKMLVGGDFVTNDFKLKVVTPKYSSETLYFVKHKELNFMLPCNNKDVYKIFSDLSTSLGTKLKDIEINFK